VTPLTLATGTEKLPRRDVTPTERPAPVPRSETKQRHVLPPATARYSHCRSEGKPRGAIHFRSVAWQPFNATSNAAVNKTTPSASQRVFRGSRVQVTSLWPGISNDVFRAFPQAVHIDEK
jgi:hypothetical protein